MGVYVCYVLVPAPMHIESVRVVSQTQMAAAQNISLGRLTPCIDSYYYTRSMEDSNP